MTRRLPAPTPAQPLLHPHPSSVALEVVGVRGGLDGGLEAVEVVWRTLTVVHGRGGVRGGADPPSRSQFARCPWR